MSECVFERERENMRSIAGITERERMFVLIRKGLNVCMEEREREREKERERELEDGN
ncbi:hypothetical protein [Cylindrospermopsis raciborskii]|uniref:hypothetical protein n=1 Tax=Cylindrospermopsis raciborskii TaxID=77022 RepID=UPI0022C6729C|nr:hypothetical protein [Cylindrospermopsis raciborskii]MCZ2208009.1 hypothetical protein [Cylindrospermopsis raciborskii PAMP2011]